MPITRRIIVGLIQVIAATIAGYLAAFAVIMTITPIFAVGLLLAAAVGSLAVWGVGRLFRLHGALEMALIGAGIGAALGFALLLTGAARDNGTAYAILALIPGMLATLAYHWGDLRKRGSGEGR